MMTLGWHDNETLMIMANNTTMTTNGKMTLEKWIIEYCIRILDV